MIVNVKSRVSMPQEDAVYESDSKMDKITVFCDRYYNGIDLSTFNAYLKIAYADGRKNVCNMSLEAQENVIKMEMPIDRNITLVAGELQCQPMLKTDDGTTVFNASVFTLSIHESIQAYEYFDMNTLPSTTQELEKKMDEAISKLTPDDKPQEGSVQTVTSGGVYSFVNSKVEEIWTVECETQEELTLKNNHEFRLGEIDSLKVTLPTVCEKDFFCEIIFIAKSGMGVIFPGDIKWSGDSVVNNVFTPSSGKLYSILIYNIAQEGVDLRGIVKGEVYAQE